ncbi:MAG: sulfite oxidase heme-binding subunit YedZ [Longimicrobiales bacterium]
MPDPKWRMRWIIKPLLWAACLTPAGMLGYWALTDGLGANPIEKITLWTGWWTLVLLMVTLSVTPIRRITGWNAIIQLRRPIGLFAFFYVCLHFVTYIVLDQFFAFGYIVEDIIERPYITVGFTAFLLLIPLAATSTKAMIRRLGRRWQRLHRLIYVSAALGTLHFFWKVKADTREPLLFVAILAVLLLFRLPWILGLLSRRSSPRQKVPSTAQPRPTA